MSPFLTKGQHNKIQQLFDILHTNISTRKQLLIFNWKMPNLADELLVNFYKTFSKGFPSKKGQRSEEQRVLKQLLEGCLFRSEEDFEIFGVGGVLHSSMGRNVHFKAMYVVCWNTTFWASWKGIHLVFVKR